MIIRKPPMGFNTWNTFGENINDQSIREIADAMVEKGLKNAGYEYLVIDDCWSERKRDPKTDRIIPDHEKFPYGMKAVSDYVHGKGLKFGMYSCDGILTCARYPGSFDHEYLDAQTFADYGCDFLKYDNCYKPESVSGESLYRRMALALRATGRDILFSACNWGVDDVHNWIRSTGAHMYRSTGDINDSFPSFRDIFTSQLSKFVYSGNNCFNDIDMLTCGMYGKGNVAVTGCTDAEYRTEFALWCMASAPLMLGCDIRNMNYETLKLVTNPGLLRINQDEEARPVFVFGKNFQPEGVYTLGKIMSDNQIAIMVVNFEDQPRDAHIACSEMGMPTSSGKKLTITSVFTDDYIEPVDAFFTIPLAPHTCDVFIGTII